MEVDSITGERREAEFPERTILNRLFRCGIQIPEDPLTGSFRNDLG